MNKRTFHTTDIAYMGLFVALITICSWISIPFTVPVTLQTFAMFAALSILGTKRAVWTVVIYIILGVIGCPVFTGFKGGFGAIFGTTGGYIIGFIFAIFISGKLIDRFGKKDWIKFLAMFAGLLVCYAFGTFWFINVYSHTNENIGIAATLLYCVVPFIIPDIIKIIMALLLSKRVKKFIK